jgi:transposase
MKILEFFRYRKQMTTKVEVRTRIVTLRQAGWTWGRVIAFMAKNFGWKVDRRTCMRLVKKFAETGSVHGKARCGRPKKLTTREERVIRRLSLANRKRNPRELAAAFRESHGSSVSSKTIKNILAKYGLRRRVAV